TTLVFGAWPCTVRFPSVALRPGAVLPLFGGLTLPWPAALPRDAVTARRADTPALHALTDRVADAVGVPRPHVVVLDERFAADSGFAGLLRRRYLRSGAPLWAVLDPAQRAALVPLEPARFGARDPSRAALTGTVACTLATMVAVFEPSADKRMQTSRNNDVVKTISVNPGQRVGEEQASTNLAEDHERGVGARTVRRRRGTHRVDVRGHAAARPAHRSARRGAGDDGRRPRCTC
ncbi:M48 family metallopeptidase, partial [Dactylosporangium aurantiacum]